MFTNSTTDENLLKERIKNVIIGKSSSNQSKEICNDVENILNQYFKQHKYVKVKNEWADLQI